MYFWVKQSTRENVTQMTQRGLSGKRREVQMLYTLYMAVFSTKKYECDEGCSFNLYVKIKCYQKPEMILCANQTPRRRETSVR